jgi:hypothetical protein
MTPDVAVHLFVLVPFFYAGLYAMTDPASSIRVVNKFMAEAHRIEANALFGDLFGEPTPIADTRASRAFLRLAGLAMMMAGLIRLYSL